MKSEEDAQGGAKSESRPQGGATSAAARRAAGRRKKKERLYDGSLGNGALPAAKLLTQQGTQTNTFRQEALQKGVWTPKPGTVEAEALLKCAAAQVALCHPSAHAGVPSMRISDRASAPVFVRRCALL